MKTLMSRLRRHVELFVFCRLVQSSDVTSDLAGVDAPLQLRPAAGRLSRVHPEVLIRDPAADLLQTGLPLRPAPQLLLHLLDLNTTTKQQQQVRHVTSEGPRTSEYENSGGRQVRT